MVALGLSGFSFEKSLWRTQCITALSQISDPHLRALFAFLTPDNDSYDIVLKESGISLSDRMAFACHYLCDNKLTDYIKTMIQNCTENGDLNGLLITGTTELGINLLQSYLDLTDDVQTVALISVKFLSKDLLSHSQVEHWIARLVSMGNQREVNPAQ
ncbi:GATOR complex protein MIOS [Pseudolycoriella hygida]|uniref:GATOR complex protein MIOS n=1 Tax=Pseudolycoriella hygida TaxID=35572 RepID=A0A9Q0RW21_9DIPT|nr:GATOR complex protein MIOS [Pseudolycoriella hygida]